MRVYSYHRSPRIDVVEDFLTADECSTLIDLAKRHGLHRSRTVASRADTSRTSRSGFLPSNEPFARLLTQRIGELLKVDVARCERVQVAHYNAGEFYRAHHDTVATTDGNWPAFASRGGHRTHTVLIYLNTLEASEGGATHFPKIDVTVSPARGRAVIFEPSHNGQLDERLLHEARAPTTDKWVSQVWVRERSHGG